MYNERLIKNICIKYNLSESVLLSFPNEEIENIINQYKLENKLNKNPVIDNIVIVERLSNNDITWKYYEDYIIDSEEFKLLIKKPITVDLYTLNKLLDLYELESRKQINDTHLFEYNLLSKKINISLSDINDIRIL